MSSLLNSILEYISLSIEGFKTEKKGITLLCTCPVCRTNPPTASIINNTVLSCTKCGKSYGNIFDIAKLIHPEFVNTEPTEIIDHVKEILGISSYNTTDQAIQLALYEKFNFDLVPIAANQKNPVEINWTNISHTLKKEWMEWLKNGLNIGVKTGKRSHITILDLDDEFIPTELNSILPNTLHFRTTRGWNFVFKYVESLPTGRLDSQKIDILNDGKQCVLPPSCVDGKVKTIFVHEIAEMPKDILNWLSSKGYNINKPSIEKEVSTVLQLPNLEDINTKPIVEGTRNSFLISFGGVLRKELNLAQTNYVLQYVNRSLCKPPLQKREVETLVHSLNKYISLDDHSLSMRIFEYMKIVEEAESRDIREALGEFGADGKQRIEKSLKFLLKEGMLIKRNRMYQIIHKAMWKEAFLSEMNTFDFKMPYFEDYAVLRNGDLTVIGGKPKIGKSTLAMCIVKKLVEQGVKPYYISLESGNRFTMTALKLGLKEGDFFWDIHFNPEAIELEKNAVTIIDWILPNDYAQTDKIFKHFVEQLVKQGGLLICFVQLKDNGTFFAPAMLPMFPALVARYEYDKEEDGTYGHFSLDYIREPKLKIKKCTIPCRYDFETRKLEIIEQ